MTDNRNTISGGPVSLPTGTLCTDSGMYRANIRFVASSTAPAARQRQSRIRRYAELIEAKEARETEQSLVVQVDAPTDLRKDGRRKGSQHEKGTASKIAEQTGLSKSTVQRALKRPDPET